MPEQVTLKRTLGLPMLTFYGLGTIVGGGFYALIGKVAGEAGMHTPLAFLVAAGIALISAFSFAELSARFPLSAGEAHYVLQAFGSKALSATVGWMVIATGVVSAATLARAFAGFLESLAGVPEQGTMVAMVVGLGLVAAIGIGESAVLTVVITVIELAGLLFVLWSAGGSLGSLPARLGEVLPGTSAAGWPAEGSGILLGAYIGFYSFVGFEDMVNVAEEVKRPARNLPRAIFLSVGVTGVLYFSVTLVTVLTVPQAALIASKAPLSLAVDQGAAALTIVGMLAGVNGGLVQIVMASRVAYGMARKGQAPSVFAHVHRWTRTPLEATAAGTACVLVLALWFPLVALAKATSTVLLVVYAIVNLALWWIKRRDRQQLGGEPPSRESKGEGPCYPAWIPAAGFLTCLAFLAFHAISTFAP